MAVTANALNSALIISFQSGTDEGGAPIVSRRTLNDIKATASDQDVFDVAQSLYALQQYPLLGIRRDNRFELSEED
jgi:hypothetical protein